MATSAGTTLTSPRNGDHHSGTTIVRLFTAGCCGAGDAMRSGIADAVAYDRNSETVVVEEIDVWKDPRSAVDSLVLTLPTLIVLRNRCEVARLAGLRSSRSIRNAIAPTGSKRRARNKMRILAFGMSRASANLKG